MNNESPQIARLSTQAALEKQAFDLVILQVGELTDIADYFILANGRTQRQIETIVDAIEERLNESGFKPISIEGRREGSWVLLDYSGVIIHVFTPETREYYRLENLWISAPSLDPEKFLQV